MRAKKTTVGNVVLAAALLATLWLCTGGDSLAASSSSEEALRARVGQLYAALQQGNWGEAEKYLTKESKQLFRYQSRTPLLGYQIESVKLDPGGDTATVAVKVPTMVPFSAQPILTSQKTQWRLLRHTWYMEYSKPDPKAAQAFLPKTSKPDPKAPGIHLGSTDLKFQTLWVSLGEAEGNEVKIARFPFTNVSKHNVTVDNVQTSCDCLRLKTQQKEFKPGEAGVLEFELDPSSLLGSGTQAVTLGAMVKTQPENAVTKLTMGLAVYPDSTTPAPP
jgi:hypothetical protein